MVTLRRLLSRIARSLPPGGGTPVRGGFKAACLAGLKTLSQTLVHSASRMAETARQIGFECESRAVAGDFRPGVAENSTPGTFGAHGQAVTPSGSLPAT